MRSLSLISAFVIALLTAPFAIAKERSVTLNVSGMTCPSCPYMVKKSLAKVNGVINVKVSLEEGKAWVVFDDAQANTAQLTAATGDIGFPSKVSK